MQEGTVTNHLYLQETMFSALPANPCETHKIWSTKTSRKRLESAGAFPSDVGAISVQALYARAQRMPRQNIIWSELLHPRCRQVTRISVGKSGGHATKIQE